MREEQTLVGIDGLAVYVPRLFVDLNGEWADRRASGSSLSREAFTSKVMQGIGMRRMAVPDAHEDSATMAAMAVKKLIDGLALDPTQLGYLAIGTETTVDQSKSIGAYVLGMLSRHYGVRLSSLGCPQFQFACIGATYALEAGMAMLGSGALDSRYAIVVGTDIARYPLRGSAECTQGAGAVAMCVAKSPRLVSLDARNVRTITLDEQDFFRPNGRDEAVVDGRRSIGVYLRCLDETLREAVVESAKRGIEPRRALEANYYLFHTPFPKMANYAAARVYRRIESVGNGCSPADWGTDQEQERAEDRCFAESAGYVSWFNERCAPALVDVSRVGNIYTGALYLCLASLCEQLSRRGSDPAGKEVLLFSYGSGASAKLLRGKFREGARQVIDHVNVGLDANGSKTHRALTVSEYERLHRSGALSAGASARSSVIPPSNEFALVGLGGAGAPGELNAGYRYYEFIR